MSKYSRSFILNLLSDHLTRQSLRFGFTISSSIYIIIQVHQILFVFSLEVNIFPLNQTFSCLNLPPFLQQLSVVFHHSLDTN